MIEIIAVREDDEIKAYMIKTLASYMKQQYLIWNKDSVSEETIFKDIYTLSGGRITVPADIHIGMGQLETPIHSRSTIPAARSNNYRNNINKGKGNNNNNKRWKNNK
ncbi:MAG: DUF4290 domain-containing protein [Bacteroidales bacterium]